MRNLADETDETLHPLTHDLHITKVAQDIEDWKMYVALRRLEKRLLAEAVAGE